MSVVIDDPIYPIPPRPDIEVPEVPPRLSVKSAMYPYFDPACEIRDFRYIDWLILGRAPTSLLRHDREAMYVVMEDYKVKLTIDGHTRYIIVPKGMTTDLTSVPRWARSIVGRVGPHLEACIVHDWLYIAWQLQDREPTKADWKFANRVLYAGLKAAKVSWVVRTGIKIAMEAPGFSWGVFKKRDINKFVDLEEMGR